MPTRRRHLQRSPGLILATHIAQIQRRRPVLRRCGGWVGNEGNAPDQVGDDVEQVRRRQHFQSIDQGRLIGVGLGQDQAPPGLTGGHGEGQHAGYRPQPTIEGQFAGTLDTLQCGGGQLAGSHQQTQRDGQIEASTLLGQIGGSKIQGNTA